MQLNYIISVFLLAQSVNAAFNMKDLFNLGRNLNNTLSTSDAITDNNGDDYTTYAHTHSSTREVSYIPTDIVSGTSNDYTSDNFIIPPTTTTSERVFPSVNPSDYQYINPSTYSNTNDNNPSTYRKSDTNTYVNPSTYRKSDTNTNTDTQIVYPTSTFTTPIEFTSSTSDVANTDTIPTSQSSITQESSANFTTPLLFIPTSSGDYTFSLPTTLFSSENFTSSGFTVQPTNSIINSTWIGSSTSEYSSSTFTIETPGAIIPTSTPTFTSEWYSTSSSSSSSPSSFSFSSSSSSSTTEQIIIPTSATSTFSSTSSSSSTTSTPEVILPPSTISSVAPVATQSSVTTQTPMATQTPSSISSISSTETPISHPTSSMASAISNPFFEVSSTTPGINTQPFSIISSTPTSATPVPLSSVPEVNIPPVSTSISTPESISASIPSSKPPVESTSSQEIIVPPTTTDISSVAQIISTPSTPPPTTFISISTSTPSSHTIVSFDPSATSTTITTISYSGMSFPPESTIIEQTPSSHIIVSFDPSATSTTTTTVSYSGMPFPTESTIIKQIPSSVVEIDTVSSQAPQPTTTKIVSVSSHISVNDNVSTTVLIASTTHAPVVSPISANQTAPRPTTTLISSITPSPIVSSVSSKQDPNWWIPTQIITDSDTSTTAQHTLNSSETANIPQMIMSPDGEVEAAVGYSLITIGFKRSLNYQFVVSNPQSSVQIMSFLPNVLSKPFNNTFINSSVIRLVPLQDDSIPYLVTVAEVYFPQSSIDDLAAMIKDQSSEIYTKKGSSNAIDTLAQLIDPSIPITGLIGDSNMGNGYNNNNNGNSANGNNSNQSQNNNDDGNNSSGSNDSGSLDGSNVGFSEFNGKNANGKPTSVKSKKKVAGIVIGSVIGAIVYFVIMGFLLRYGINRYKKQCVINYPMDENSSISSNESSFNEKMNNSPSWSSNINTNSNTNTMMSEELGVGINAKKGKSVKLKISGPLASENSLGF